MSPREPRVQQRLHDALAVHTLDGQTLTTSGSAGSPCAMARFQLAHDLDERLLAGLLQGILKRSILLDSTITEAVLVESVFAASRATAPGSFR